MRLNNALFIETPTLIEFSSDCKKHYTATLQLWRI